MSNASADSPETVEDCPGLCRVCGRTVLPPTDPGSCTASLCSEGCLAEALIAYWAAQGVTATVVLRNGYARLEGVGSKDGARPIFRGIADPRDLQPLLSSIPRTDWSPCLSQE
jgi:hypothetical protein